MNVLLDTIEKYEPFQNFEDYIRNPKTLSDYTNTLSLFFRDEENTFKNHIAHFEELTIKEQSAIFTHLLKIDLPGMTRTIRNYVGSMKERVNQDAMKPATLRNRLKGIKALMEANDVEFKWKKINKGLPKSGKGKDRAYTRPELQKMIAKSPKLVDKVIVTFFTATGIRVGAWDDLTWGDVIFFYNENKAPKGFAVKIYSWSDEEYWTHGTPESANYLLLYKEQWNNKFGSYPRPTEPLLTIENRSFIRRMRASTVRSRMVSLTKSCGIRFVLDDRKKRHEVMIDHGMRKYFNTMCRRAKIDFADKEDMMGHDVAQEGSYGRYVEDDFELWPEYQKAIPFLTIDDTMRQQLELDKVTKEKSDLIKINSVLEETVKEKDIIAKKYRDVALNTDVIENAVNKRIDELLKKN